MVNRPLTVDANPAEAEVMGMGESATEAASAAAPVLEFGSSGTPYAAYIGIDVLHALQRPHSDEPTEVTFIVATQVMELLFGQLAREWTHAQRALRDNDLPEALAALRRGVNVQNVLLSSWELLAPLTPVRFNAFRDLFGTASGFQSHAYRRLEFLLGNKSAAMLRPHTGDRDVHADLDRALRAPSLYDDVLAFLHRRGLPIPLSHLDRDWSLPYEPHPDVEKAWLTVYTDPAHRDVAELAESLLDVAQRVTDWRHRHYTAVKRSMGGKPGSGGSSGLTWLRKAVDRDAFPELWAVRDQL